MVRSAGWRPSAIASPHRREPDRQQAQGAGVQSNPVLPGGSRADAPLQRLKLAGPRLASNSPTQTAAGKSALIGSAAQATPAKDPPHA